jgi:2-polyprenyl-6-methoxyphenol hydroxylase-like FAD-dependent oxidoreductase
MPFVLDGLLAEIAAQAGADLIDGFVVADLPWSDGKVAGARGRTSGSPTQSSLPARLVVSADGLHSTVARKAGARLLLTAPTAQLTLVEPRLTSGDFPDARTARPLEASDCDILSVRARPSATHPCRGGRSADGPGARPAGRASVREGLPGRRAADPLGANRSGRRVPAGRKRATSLTQWGC